MHGHIQPTSSSGPTPRQERKKHFQPQRNTVCIRHVTQIFAQAVQKIKNTSQQRDRGFRAPSHPCAYNNETCFCWNIANNSSQDEAATQRACSFCWNSAR
ncbi:unnamed protein product [Ectocarpus sp. 12 AP-2014]